VEFSSDPLLTIDEVEPVQRKRLVSLVGHVFHLTYAAMLDKLIFDEKVNRCNGCTIQHLSQRQHSRLMMDKDDAWMYQHNDVSEKVNLGVVVKIADSVRNGINA